MRNINIPPITPEKQAAKMEKKIKTEEDAKEILLKWFEKKGIQRKDIAISCSWGLTGGQSGEKWYFDILGPLGESRAGIFNIDPYTGEVEDSYSLLERKEKE